MFEWLFNYPKSDFDAGALTFTSGYPAWLLYALLIVIGVVLALSLWWRRQHLSAPKLTALWCLQTAAASLLLLMIWQPALDVKALRSGENTVAVLLDNSSSMYLEHKDTKRIDVALQALNNSVAPSLGRDFNISLATVGKQLDVTDSLESLPAPSSRSNITGSLLEVLNQARAKPLSAVVIATDGSDNTQAFEDTTTDNFWDQLSAFNVPIHTIGIGRTALPEDMEITDVQMATTTLPGSLERSVVTIRHGGSANNATARVKVFSGENLIALQEQPLPVASGETTISIDIDATDTGLKELRFEVEAGANDTSLQNNTRRRLLQVEEKQRRILYFEGEPRWEYKFIRRAVAKAKGVALVTILRTTPNKFYRQGIDSPEQHANGFPVTKAELYDYDAVIIGNVDAISLNATQHQLLHDFVSERGGAIMMLAGNSALSDGGWENSPLAKALPVELTKTPRPSFERIRAKASLTNSGQHAAITRLATDPATNETLWSELPELADFQRTGKLKPGASTLLEVELADGMHPLLTSQHYGKGNSYILASSGTWRWQMQMPSEDQRHEIFWQQLLQTIGATAPDRMTIATDKQIYLDHSTVQITANLLSDEFVPVSNAEVLASLTAPDGSVETIPLKANPQNAGEFFAKVEAPLTGSWQIDIAANEAEKQIASATRWIYREDGTAESYALAQNTDFLRRIASVTGGGYWTTDEADDIAGAVAEARNGIVRLTTLPLWNMPLFFLLLLGLKLVEWMLRMIWGRL